MDEKAVTVSEAKPEPTLSVIVPTLNEEARIANVLADLTARNGISEITVADGGSHDRTREIVRGFERVKLVEASRGRGIQMNAGAAGARGEILLFLHADAKLPANAVSRIIERMRDERFVGGAFRIRTICDAKPSWVARLLFLADIRSHYTRRPYGDQAIFVRRAIFNRIGGYPDQPLMEDLEFSMRLRRQGKLLRLRERVEVSGRRFLQRPIFYAVVVNIFPLLYRIGVSPETLKRVYDDVR